MIFLLCALSLLAACSTDKLLKKEESAIEKEKAHIKPPIPRVLPDEKPAVPEKKPDPLAGKTITLTANNASFTEIFTVIADIAGLDLVIDSRLISEERALSTRNKPQASSTSSAAPASQEAGGGTQANLKPIVISPVTVAFNKTPLDQALENITQSLNVFYEIKGRCMYIRGVGSKAFHLNFISAQKETKIGVGGDVLGGGSSSGGSGGSSTSSGPIMGMFSIQGTTTTASSDMYAQIEQVVKSSLTEYGSFSLNRAIGFLEVYDRKNSVDRIESYITKLKAFYNCQVLITAKILEVSLNDSSVYGIDWSSVNGYIKGYHFDIQQNLAFSSDSITPALSVGIQNTKSGIDATIEALQQFGDIKVLSNPRIRVTNGQPALISVGTNQTYVEKIERTVTTSEGQTNTEYEVTIGSIFDGVMFGVQPYIDLESNEINLSITPIKNRIVSMNEKDVGQGLGVYSLPVVDLKTATTQLRVKSGDVAVLGGLISKSTKNLSTGIPILGTVPGLEYLFSQQTKIVETDELVILLEPVIIQP